jgi:hypothetical protein
MDRPAIWRDGHLVTLLPVRIIHDRFDFNDGVCVGILSSVWQRRSCRMLGISSSCSVQSM